MATQNLGLETKLIGAGPTLENALVRNFEKLDAAAVGEGGSVDTSVEADAASGLAAAANLQDLAIALSNRIKALEDAAG